MAREYFVLLSVDEGGLNAMAERAGPDVRVLENTRRDFVGLASVIDARFGGSPGDLYVTEGGWVALAYRDVQDT
jgi:hypothetical protein